MLNIKKNIWIKPHKSEERNESEQVKKEQVLRLYDEYEKEMDAVIIKDPDYTELQTIIYEKEREVLQLLSALDILYKSKDTTRENLEGDYRMANPFLHEELLRKAKTLQGLTGYTGYTGVPGYSGFSGFTGPGVYTGNSTTTNTTANINQIASWQPKKNP